MANAVTDPQQQKILILGIGNILWADEGLGIRAVDYLHRHYYFAEQVELLDGGCQGVALLEKVQTADHLIIFDAVDFGLADAELKVCFDDEIPKYLSAGKMSLHQTSFQEVLSMAQLLDTAPKHIVLIGIQPAIVNDYGGSLSPAVQQQLPSAISACLDYLSSQHIQWQKLSQPRHSEILFDALEQGRYETQRPDSNQACRQGDMRFLLDPHLCFVPKSPLKPDALSVSLDKRKQ